MRRIVRESSIYTAWRRALLWAAFVLVGLASVWPLGQAEACSKACVCTPGRWVPNTAEVPFNAKGIYWIKNQDTCHSLKFAPKAEDFKWTNTSEDPPTEVAFQLKEYENGVFLLEPTEQMTNKVQYKIEYLGDPCKDQPSKQEVKPLIFKAVEEGSFPAGEKLELTRTNCDYQADNMCDGSGVKLAYKVTLPNALKPWTDMWQAQLLIDGEPVPSTITYGTMSVATRLLCEKPKSGVGKQVGEYVVQMELSLPGTGRSYRSSQIRVAVKCEKQNTCTVKGTAKAGDPPPPAGCGCQTTPTTPQLWPFFLVILGLLSMRARKSESGA